MSLKDPVKSAFVILLPRQIGRHEASTSNTSSFPFPILSSSVVKTNRHLYDRVRMARNHGTAGKGARKMADGRYLKVLICSLSLLFIAFLFLSNYHLIAKLGLPAVIIVAIGVYWLADYIEVKGKGIKKRAKDADRGARAEEVVAERLVNLPDGYRVFNDIAFDGFNVDHVVVGPGGIFLIETKSHRGNVESKGDNLLIDGKQPSKNFLNQTWRQTYQLRDFLNKHTSRDWKIWPVLCFTRAFVSVHLQVKGIAVVNGKYLAAYLMRHQQRLSTEDIEIVTKVLKSKFAIEEERKGDSLGT